MTSLSEPRANLHSSACINLRPMNRKLCFRAIFHLTLDLQIIAGYLLDLRRSGVRPHVHHVDPGGDERREDQAVPFLGGVAKAAAAGVPARVV